MHRIDHLLPWSCLGTQRTLSVFSFGAGERKAYIQASLHADELPGMRVAVALKRRLRELEQAGQLRGVIELVPVANPIGLAQVFQATHQGRFEFGSGKNFNRDFVQLDRLIGDQLEGYLQADAQANLRLIRQFMLAALDALPAATSEFQGLQRLLLRHACDADIVLDLHCDFEAAVHLYSIPQHWPAWQPLARRIKAAAVLLAEDSGGGSFDEVCSAAWLNLARRFAAFPIPLGCMATALELGGMADTESERTEAQAEAILGFLADQGLISGDWPSLPADCCAATPFEGAQYALAPHAGVVSFMRSAGDRVEPGDPLFEVHDPLDDRHSIVRAETAGVIYACERLRFAQPGLWLAKVAGATPIRQGRLLSD